MAAAYDRERALEEVIVAASDAKSLLSSANDDLEHAVNAFMDSDGLENDPDADQALKYLYASADPLDTLLANVDKVIDAAGRAQG